MGVPERYGQATHGRSVPCPYPVPSLSERTASRLLPRGETPTNQRGVNSWTVQNQARIEELEDPIAPLHRRCTFVAGASPIITPRHAAPPPPPSSLRLGRLGDRASAHARPPGSDASDVATDTARSHQQPCSQASPPAPDPPLGSEWVPPWRAHSPGRTSSKSAPRSRPPPNAVAQTNRGCRW